MINQGTNPIEVRVQSRIVTNRRSCPSKIESNQKSSPSLHSTRGSVVPRPVKDRVQSKCESNQGSSQIEDRVQWSIESYQRSSLFKGRIRSMTELIWGSNQFTRGSFGVTNLIKDHFKSKTESIKDRVHSRDESSLRTNSFKCWIRFNDRVHLKSANPFEKKDMSCETTSEFDL